MDGVLMTLAIISSSAYLALEIGESGENYYKLRLLEDNKGVCTLLLYFDTPIYNEALGREEGLIHLSVAPLGNFTNHRSVGLFNELIKMLDGYDYVIDKNQYEVY